jgi:hypothetical protein
MFSQAFNNFLTIFLDFFRLSWWFLLFLVLINSFKSLYLFYKHEKYKNSKAFEMSLLEIRIPREIKKNPKAMEQILLTLHSLRNAPGSFKEKWIDGEITIWFSLEMVSINGNIKFFIRIPRARKAIIEAAFFSYYPEIELIEVDDYVLNLPQNIAELNENNLNAWGAELILQKESAYPIKTYSDFEAIDDEKKYDPTSSFLEVLGKCHKNEFIGIQFLIAPAGSDWNKKFEKIVEDLKEKKSKSNASSGAQAQPAPLPTRSPGEIDILKKVEENLSKPAFDTLIRVLYISPKELFDQNYAMRGVLGAFNQYSAPNLNGFKQNGDVAVRASIWSWPHIFPNKRKLYRQAAMLYNYLKREMPHDTFMGKLLTSNFFRLNFGSKTFLFTTTCLATLFHPPTSVVLTTPHIQILSSKKAGPPPNLPVFGEEKEIEKFYE